MGANVLHYIASTVYGARGCSPDYCYFRILVQYEALGSTGIRGSSSTCQGTSKATEEISGPKWGYRKKAGQQWPVARSSPGTSQVRYATLRQSSSWRYKPRREGCVQR